MQRNDIIGSNKTVCKKAYRLPVPGLGIISPSMPSFCRAGRMEKRLRVGQGFRDQ